MPSHNDRIRPPGLWHLGDVVTSAEFELLDQAQYEAVNGDQGGPWNPAAPIILAGQGLKMPGTDNVKLAPRSITRMQVHGSAICSPLGWVAQVNPVATTIAYRNLDVADPEIPKGLAVLLRIPHGALLTAVTMVISPAVAVRPWPVQHLPTVKVYRQSDAGIQVQVGATATDPSGSTFAYETTHPITVSGLSETVDRSTRNYFALLMPESGTNALPDGLYLSTKVTFTIAQYDED